MDKIVKCGKVRVDGEMGMGRWRKQGRFKGMVNGNEELRIDELWGESCLDGRKAIRGRNV